MNVQPVDAALRHISETAALLDSLIISSERFDYPKAKQALRKLQAKSRDLAKLKAQLASSAKAQPNICVVDFRRAESRFRQGSLTRSPE